MSDIEDREFKVIKEDKETNKEFYEKDKNYDGQNNLYLVKILSLIASVKKIKERYGYRNKY